MPAEEPVGLDVIAFKDELLDLGKLFVSTFDSLGIRPAAPVGLFVELDALFVGFPEDHRPEAAVPDGQRLRPLRRRVFIPELETGPIVQIRNDAGSAFP